MAGQIGTITVGAKLAGGTQQAFKAIADGMRTMAKAMSALAKDTKALGNTAQSKAFGSMAKEMNNWSAQLEKVSSGTVEAVVQTKALAAAQADAAKTTEQLDKELAEEAEQLAKASGGMKKHEAAAEVLRIRYQELLNTNSAQSAEAQKWIASLQAGTANMAVAREQVARYNKEFTQGITAQNKYALTLDNVRKKYESLFNSQDKFGREAKRVRQEFKKGGFDLAKYAEKLQEIKTRQSDTNKTFEKSWNAANRLERQYDALVSSSTEFAAKAKGHIQALRDTDIDAEKAREELFKLNKEFKKTAEGKIAAEKLRKSIKDIRVDFERLRKTQDAYGAGARKLIQLLKAEKIDVDSVRKALRHLEKQQRRTNQAKIDSAKALSKARYGAQKLELKYQQLIKANSKYAVTAKKTIQLLRDQKISAERAAIAVEKLNRRYLDSLTPMTQAITRLGRSFRTYMSYVAASSTIFAFIGATREATRTIIEFDQALKDLQAITRATDEEVARMSERMKQVASDTKFSAVEVAEGMKLLGQSGFSAQESMNTIGAVADLATGTLTDFATTVDLVTTAMRVWNIDSTNSAHVADVFANAVNRSKLTIDKIRTSLNYIGPVARAAGASIEETASAMMIMANQGIRASTIGTGLRQVFRRIVQPSTAMKKAIHDANLTMEDFDIRSQGLQTVLDNLTKVVDDNADAFAMFGQRGATAVLAMTKGGGEALRQMMVIVERTGAAADMAAIQMEGLGVSFKNLGDKIKNLYLAMGDNGLAGAFRIFVDVARTVVDLMTGAMNNNVVLLTTKIAGLTAGIWGLTKAFQALGKVLGISSGIVALTGAITGYTTATNAAAVATTRFSGALRILGKLGPFLVVGGIISLIQLIDKFTESTAEAEKSLRTIKALRDSYEDSAIALRGLTQALQNSNVTEEEKADILDRLVRAYPELSREVKKAQGNIEKLTPALQRQIDKLQEMADAQTLAQMRKQYQLALKAREEAAKAYRQLHNADTDQERARYATLHKDKLKIYQDYLTGISQAYNDYSQRHQETLDELLPPISTGLFSNPDREIIARRKIEQQNEEINKKREKRVKQEEEEAEALIAQQKELTKLYRERLSVMEEMDENTVSDRVDRALDEPDFVAKDYAEDKSEFDELLAYKEYQLEISRALDLRSEEQVLDAKYRNQMEYYDKLIERAKLANEEARILGQDPATFQEDIDKFQEAKDQLKLKRLQYYAKEREKTEKDITNLVEEQEKVKTKYREQGDDQDEALDKARKDRKKALHKKEIELEKAYKQKVVEIREDLEKKLKEIDKKRIDAEKAKKRAVLDLENKFEEQMLGLEQRGMSDAEIELSNKSFARETFAKAQQTAQKAILEGDKELLAVAQELYDTSGGYFGDLADTSAARSGLTAVKDGKLAILDAQERLTKAELNAEEQSARDEAKAKEEQAIADMKEQLQQFIDGEDNKLQVVKDRIQVEREEQTRLHNEFMQQQDTEIAKLKEKLAAVEQSRQATLNTNLRTQKPGGAVTGGDYAGHPTQGLPSISQEDQKRLVKVHERAAAEGISKGIKDKQVATSIEEISGTGLGEKIAEDVGAGVQQGLSQIEQYTQVGDQSLEEWRKSGEKQGEAAGEAAGEKIGEEIDKAVIEYNEQGEPVGLRMEAAAEDVDTMIDGIQDTLADSPFELAIDEREFARQMEILVRNAQSKYKITIPVTVRQANAEGGPVYKMASGGRLPGQSGPHDTLDVKARPGEWFIRNEAVAEWQRRIGNWFMPGVNRPNSMPGKYLQSLLVHGNQQNSVPEIPNLGKMTINLGGRSAEIMGTPVNLKNFVNMMKDAEAFSS